MPSQTAALAPSTPWSLRIGHVRGVPIDVHVTFLVLLAWVALSPLWSGGSLEEGLEAAATTAAVFATVVLHELGHATVGRRFGFETTRILLLPIGGIATMPRMPTRPVEELLVAIAGPLVNVTIALVLGVFLFTYDHTLGLTGASLVGAPLVTKLLWINVALAAFNVIPAFPMDGGRVLRALLAIFVGHARATVLAVRLGQTIALALGIFGLVFQPMLALIALFVWGAARAEIYTERARAVLHGVTVERVMTRRVDTIEADTPLSLVAERLLADVPHDFVVARAGRVVGILTRRDVLRGLSLRSLDTEVERLMHTELVTTTRGEMLEDVLPRMSESGLGAAVVLDGDHAVGVVTAESIGELLTLGRPMARAVSGPAISVPDGREVPAGA